MIAISIVIEGQWGLTWPRWKRLADEIESLGFAGLFRSDHFTINAQPPDEDSLELIVSLAYLADHTRRVHFGPLVSPLSFRDPIMLARQAAALDDLSGGRMILGVGAGWNAREHAMFGYDLGDVPTRMARLEEGLEVMSRLLRNDEPVTYSGRFYQLREAVLLPRPQRPGGPRILIGGNGPRRTLPLAARYADIWNGGFLTPDEFHELSATLDDLLRAVGRQPGEVRRTLMTTLIFVHPASVIERQIGSMQHLAPKIAGKPPEAQLAILRADLNAIAGSADSIIEQIRAYAAAGVEELMLGWLDQEDIEGLRIFAREVLPHLNA
jgi:F420-dependent oxidoreductase-like protein